MSRSLSEARPTSSIAIRTFGKKISSLAESDQHVRHGEQVQPCLMRSHAGPEYMREPGSISMKCPLVRERAARRVSQTPSKINHRHASAPSVSYFAGVMQDKELLNFVARICTTQLIPPDQAHRAGKVNCVDRLHLAIELVRPNARNARCSNVPVHADGAGGSGIGYLVRPARHRVIPRRDPTRAAVFVCLVLSPSDAFWGQNRQ